MLACSSSFTVTLEANCALQPQTDHPLSRGQEHRMGVLWWQEATGDPVWRLVIICQLLPRTTDSFPIDCAVIRSLLFLSTVSRSPHPVTQCPPSAATTWCMTGSKAWPSVCTGTCARGRHDWRTARTHPTPKTETKWHVFKEKEIYANVLCLQLIEWGVLVVHRQPGGHPALFHDGKSWRTGACVSAAKLLLQ